MSLKIFGNKLKELRSGKDLSQNELGQKLGVGAKQVQRYEKGEVLPDYDKMQTLKDLFQYDFYSLLTDKSTANGSHDGSTADLQLVKAISLESLAEIRKLAEGQKRARAEIRAFGEYQVMKDSRNDEKSRQRIMAQINKIVALNLKEIQRRDSYNAPNK